MAQLANDAETRLTFGAVSDKNATSDANEKDVKIASLHQSQPVKCPTTRRVYPALTCFHDGSWFLDSEPPRRALSFDGFAMGRRNIVQKYDVGKSYQLLFGSK